MEHSPAPAPLLQQLAAALRAYRALHGLTLTQLAERLDCSQPYLSQLESGRKNVSLAVVDTIAARLGLRANLTLT